jgi:hypothetical protein
MIADIFLYIIGQLIHFVAGILPTWTVWPASLLDGLSYFCSSMAKLNFLIPIDSIFAVILFMVNFEVAWLGAKLLLKLANYIRGTGSGIEI